MHLGHKGMYCFCLCGFYLLSHPFCFTFRWFPQFAFALFMAVFNALSHWVWLCTMFGSIFHKRRSFFTDSSFIDSFIGVPSHILRYEINVWQCLQYTLCHPKHISCNHIYTWEGYVLFMTSQIYIYNFMFFMTSCINYGIDWIRHVATWSDTYSIQNWPKT